MVLLQVEQSVLLVLDKEITNCRKRLVRQPRDAFFALWLPIVCGRKDSRRRKTLTQTDETWVLKKPIGSPITGINVTLAVCTGEKTRIHDERVMRVTIKLTRAGPLTCDV